MAAVRIRVRGGCWYPIYLRDLIGWFVRYPGWFLYLGELMLRLFDLSGVNWKSSDFWCRAGVNSLPGVWVSLAQEVSTFCSVDSMFP